MKKRVNLIIFLLLGFISPKISGAQKNDVDLGKQLFDSVVDRDINSAKRLILDGANVNYKGAVSSSTPLMLAAMLHDLGLVKLLVKHHADVRAVNRIGRTALHSLVVNRSYSFDLPEMIDILVAAGADINAQDNEGDTPLHRAAQENYYLGVHCLLNSGANQFIRNKAGKLPINLVAWGNVMLRDLFAAPARSKKPAKNE